MVQKNARKTRVGCTDLQALLVFAKFTGRRTAAYETQDQTLHVSHRAALRGGLVEVISGVSVIALKREAASQRIHDGRQTENIF